MKKEIVVMRGSDPAEIFQSLDIKFALLNDNYEEVHLGIKCRDFLGDCIWSKATGKRAFIYGFTYDYAEKPYSDNPKMSLKFPDAESMGNFLKNIDFLNFKEHDANLSLTAVHTTQVKNTLIVEFDKAWMEGPWKISLYTFFIKLCSYEDVTKPEDPESDYLKYLTDDKLAVLLDAVTSKPTTYWAEDIGEAHNYSGFVSVLKQQNQIGKELFMSKAA